MTTRNKPRRIASRADLVKALVPYARPDTLEGLMRFGLDYYLFLLGSAIALLATNPLVRILGGILAGMKMSSLYAVAHDCAHNVLVPSKRLNKVLGSIAYLTGFYNYRLRLYDHLLKHHPMVNGPQPDAYRPMSLAQFRAMPRWRQLWERFIRSANPLAWCAYAMAARLMKSETFPKKGMPADVRRGAWGYAALMFGYVGMLLAIVAVVSGFEPGAFAVNALFMLGVPFLAFQANQAIVVYLQHTDPRIPWFAPGDERHLQHGAEQLSVHVAMPRWISSFFHHMFCHAAHHVCPSVPCYRLYDAQARLDELLKDESVVIPFRIGALLDVFARCKLYDYEHHRWLDFEGNATSPQLVPRTHAPMPPLRPAAAVAPLPIPAEA